MWPDTYDSWEGTLANLLEAAVFAVLFCALALAALASFSH